MKKINLFGIFGVFVLLLVNVFIAKAVSFPDVADGHLNSVAIEYIKNNGIVSGYPDGNFQPDLNINRAEFTKIIIGAQFDMTTIDNCITENIQTESTNVFFPDVPKDEWFAKYVCVAKRQHIIDGYPDGTFQPGNMINFAESAKIISNAFGFESSGETVWYKPFVENLAEKNAIPTTITRFDSRISRGEMAEMIYRLKANVTTKESWDYETIKQMITLNVYFQTLKENANLIDCGKTEVVKRMIPNTSTPAMASLEQLFNGPTDAEKAAGLLDFWITAETGNNLKRVFIKDGIVYLDWQDLRQIIPNASSSCGSVGFLKPIENTLKQFSTITKVIHAIDGDPATFYEWMQMGCSAENNNCDATPYQTTSLPTSCTDEVEGAPVITSISTNSGSVGTSLEIHGCNFAGFEGDKNAWIENSEGVKGILYSESGSTANLLKITLKSPLCQIDNSYSGLPCETQFLLNAGIYQIYVMPWGKTSNKVEFSLVN